MSTSMSAAGRCALATSLACLSLACGSYEVRRVPSKTAATSATVASSATNPATGSVCVARPDDDVAGSPVPVWDNAVLVGASTRGSHYCWAAAPGRHYLTAELLVTTELVVEVRAGATTWVGMETDTSLQNSGVGSRGYRGGRRRESVRLVLLEETKGEELRASTAEIELVDVPSDQRPPPHTPIPAR